MGGKEDDNINSPFFMKFDWVEGVDRQGSSCKGMIEYFLFGFGLCFLFLFLFLWGQRGCAMLHVGS